MNLKQLTSLAIGLCSASAFAEMSCDNVEQTTVTQCETLVSFWQETNGSSWTNANENKWLKTNNPCEWEGVTCWGSRVVYLQQSNNNLSGNVPDLSGLVDLRFLELSKGAIHSIPDLSRLKKLHSIYLFDNQITGLLPNLTHLSDLKKLVIHNNPGLFGPLTFNGNSNAALPVFHNTGLCQSRHIDYQQWSASVSSTPFCEGQSVYPIMSLFDVVPNDGRDDHHGLNNFFEMLHYDSHEYGNSSVNISFLEGVYEFDQALVIDNLKQITMAGVGGPEVPWQGNMDLSKTNFIKSDKFQNSFDRQTGSLLAFKGGSENEVKNIVFHGTTSTSTQRSIGDHGVTLMNTMNNVINSNQFVNFGDGALAVITDEGYESPSILNRVEYNQFDNICQVTTDGNVSGSEGLRFEYNKINDLKCSLFFHSKQHLTGQYSDRFLEINHNTISGPGAEAGFYSNGIEVSGYSNVKVKNNQIKHGPNFAIALRSHLNSYNGEKYDWGHVEVSNNIIDDYKQAILVHSVNYQDGSFPFVSNIQVFNNQILSSWNSLKQAHIHFIGEQFDNSRVHSNDIHGGLYSIWPKSGVEVYGNNFQPSNTFDLGDYTLNGPNLIIDSHAGNPWDWDLSSDSVYEPTRFKMTQAYAPMKNGLHDYFWSRRAMNVEAGKSYLFFTKMYRASSGLPKGAVMVQFRRADGSFHSNSVVKQYYNSRPNYPEYVGIDFVVPEGAAAVKVSAFMYENSSDASNDATLYFDDLHLVELGR